MRDSAGHFFTERWWAWREYYLVHDPPPQVKHLAVFSLTALAALLRGFLLDPARLVLATLDGSLVAFLNTFLLFFVAARLLGNLLRYRFVC